MGFTRQRQDWLHIQKRREISDDEDRLNIKVIEEQTDRRLMQMQMVLDILFAMRK